MRARFCCSELKEYKVLDVAVQGIRRCESVKRNERYKEPQICRYYSKNEKVSVFLPILEWSDEDVEDFIMERGIKCAPVYYDKQGRFYVERRLGCMACPLRSDRGKGDFIKHPILSVHGFVLGRFGGIITQTQTVTRNSVPYMNCLFIMFSLIVTMRLSYLLEVECSEIELTASNF